MSDEQNNKKRQDNENQESESNIPFEELVNLRGIRTLKTDTEESKKRMDEFNAEPPVYDPYLSFDGEAEDHYHPPDLAEEEVKAEEKTPAKSPEKESLEKTTEKEPVTPSSPAKQPPSSGYKDEETLLRESLNYIAKEISEWSQKLEYYNKNQTKVVEEREDFIIKKEGLEKILKPILDKEKKIEEEVKAIEKEEQEQKTEEERRKKEKERWAKEEERKAIEEKKWAQMGELRTVEKFIEERNRLYETLNTKKNEAQTKLSELHSLRGQKESQLRLIHIKALKAEVEANKNRIESQIKSVANSVEGLTKSEMEIQTEKKNIEEKERQSATPEEERANEVQRWGLEEKLRMIEQERWSVLDKQNKLKEMQADIRDQYQKILKHEAETLEKLGQTQEIQEKEEENKASSPTNKS